LGWHYCCWCRAVGVWGLEFGVWSLEFGGVNVPFPR
jgi:hypothetical protein